MSSPLVQSPFDFTLDLYCDRVHRKGHYSQSSDRDASREEILMWNRILELEQVLRAARPEPVKNLLRQLDRVSETASYVRVNAESFALLRAHAQDRVKMLVDTTSNQIQLLGELRRVVDGRLTTVWVQIDHEVPDLTVLPGEL
jgi:hypothetical protein